jgi:hypothetical protein
VAYVISVLGSERNLATSQTNLAYYSYGKYRDCRLLGGEFAPLSLLCYGLAGQRGASCMNTEWFLAAAGVGEQPHGGIVQGVSPCDSHLLGGRNPIKGWGGQAEGLLD